MDILGKFLYLSAIVVSCLSCKYAAAYERKLFPTLSVESGMPHSEVTAITADPSGFLWFGTYNGLARYDGYSLHTISKDEEDGTFKSLRITALYCDPAEMLMYVGTEDEGLRIIDLRSEKIISRLYFANSIYSICKGLENRLWIGTDKGTVQMDLRDKDFGYRYVETSLSKVYDVAEIDGNILLTASESGINRIDLTSGRIEPVLAGPFSRAVCKMDGENYLFGTSEGLFRYDYRAGTLERIADIDVYCIHRGAGGEYWVGSLFNGIYRFDRDMSGCIEFNRKESQESDTYFPNNGARVFYEDFSGNLWIGTQNGACRYDHRAAVFEFFGEVLETGNTHSNGNKTASLYEDRQGRLWVGMFESGLKIIDRKAGKVMSVSKEQAPQLYGSTISCFYRDLQGNLWIGTWDGLYVIEDRYADTAPEMTRIPLIDIGRKYGLDGTTVFKVVQDEEDVFWFSTNDGLFRFCLTGNGYEECSLTKFFPSVETTDIYVEGDGSGGKTVWTGTRHGLKKLYFRNRTADPVILTPDNDGKNSISAGFISAIYRDSEDRIWVLCLDGYIGGLTAGRYGSGKPEFRIMNLNAEGSYYTSESLQEAVSGNLWIGGIRLIEFNPDSWTFRCYDEADGLYNGSFKIWSSLKLSTGELAFGSVDGITVFDPDALTRNIIAPKIVIEDLFLNGARVGTGTVLPKGRVVDRTLNYMDDIILPYKSNNISISFAVLHYTAPEKNRFRYRLDGYDSRWIESGSGTGKHSANYSGLAPGAYRFTVRGGNCDGVWSVSEKTLNIRILPPFWLSWPLVVFYAICLISATYLIRRRIIRRKDAMREKEMTERKLKYFTDISHEIKTPLALISAPVSELIADNELDTRTLGRLNLIRRNVARLTDLIEQIMDVSRLESKPMQLRLSEQDLVNVCLTAISYFED